MTLVSLTGGGLLTQRLVILRSKAHVLLHDGWFAARILLIVIMLGWFEDLFRNSGIFTLSHSLSWFHDHWPYNERDWSLGFGFAAVLGIVGLTAPYRTLRLICTGLIGAAHGTLAMAIWHSNGVSPGWSTYGSVAILGVWIILADERL